MIEGRLGHSFPKAIQVNAQTARLLTLQPLLPIQILIQPSRRPSHHLPPKRSALQISKLIASASMDSAHAHIKFSCREESERIEPGSRVDIINLLNGGIDFVGPRETPRGLAKLA